MWENHEVINPQAANVHATNKKQKEPKHLMPQKCSNGWSIMHQTLRNVQLGEFSELSLGSLPHWAILFKF